MPRFVGVPVTLDERLRYPQRPPEEELPYIPPRPPLEIPQEVQDWELAMQGAPEPTMGELVARARRNVPPITTPEQALYQPNFALQAPYAGEQSPFPPLPSELVGPQPYYPRGRAGTPPTLSDLQRTLFPEEEYPGQFLEQQRTPLGALSALPLFTPGTTVVRGAAPLARVAAGLLGQEVRGLPSAAGQVGRAVGEAGARAMEQTARPGAQVVRAGRKAETFKPVEFRGGVASAVETPDGERIYRIASGKKQGWWSLQRGQTEFVGKTPQSTLEIANKPAAQPAARAAEAVPKESWQMTGTEFLRKVSGLGTRPDDATLLNQHRIAVEQALEANYSVPTEVLAEYNVERLAPHNVRLTAAESVRPEAMRPEVPVTPEVPPAAIEPAVGRPGVSGAIVEGAPPTGGVPPGDIPFEPAPVGPERDAAKNIVGLRAISATLTPAQRFANRVRAILRQPQVNEFGTKVMEERRRVNRTVDSQAASLGAEAEARVAQSFRVGNNGIIEGLDATVQDVAADLGKYGLSLDQRATMEWLRESFAPYRELWDEVQQKAGNLADRKATELRTRADIKPGGFYLPRGRAMLEGADDPIKVPSGMGRGGGAGFKAAARFDTQAQGIKAGYEYSSLGESLGHYVRQIGSEISDRYAANYLLDLTDTAGVRVAQTAADRIDPVLRQDVATLATSIRGQRITAIRQAAASRGMGRSAQESARLYEQAERLARAAEERLTASLSTLRTDEVIGAMERELLILNREAVKESRRAAAAGIKSGVIESRFQSTVDQINQKQAKLFDLRGRLKRATDIAKSRPRESGTVGLVQLQGYDFPDAIANAANLVLNAERRNLNPGIVSQVNTILNGMYRTVTATLDDSAIAIQGMLGWYKAPKASEKALEVNMKALASKDAWGKFLVKFNEEAEQNGLLTTTEWTQHGLRLAGHAEEFRPGAGLSQALQSKIGNLPLLREANRIFAAYGDTLRPTWAQKELMTEMKRGKTLEQMRGDGTLDGIAAAVNRHTGYSPESFGGTLGDFLLYAPRYFQSRIETVVNGVAGLRPGASVQQRLARTSLGNMMVYGTLITVAANAALGNETDFRPVVPDGHGGWKRNPNFMRIRFNGKDWSLFGGYDSLLGMVLTVATGHGDQALRQFVTSGTLSGAWDLIAGETVIGKRTRDTKEQVARYIFEEFQPFSGKAVVQGVAGTIEQARAGEPAGVAAGIATTVGVSIGGKASELGYSDIQGIIVKEITKDNPEYAPDAAYFDLSEADKRKVRDDLRLKEKAQQFEEGPIKDELRVRVATESLEKKRTSLVADLRTNIDAGMTGKALRLKIQQFKRDSFTASDTLFNEDTKAALDRLSTRGKNPPIKDILAQRYLDVDLNEDAATGERDYEPFNEAREAILREAAALGIPEKYLTGKGPDSYRRQTITDPAVLAKLAQYDDDQETLRPYWEIKDAAERKYPGMLRPGPALNALNKAIEEAREDYLRANPKADLARQTWYGAKPVGAKKPPDWDLAPLKPAWSKNQIINVNKEWVRDNSIVAPAVKAWGIKGLNPKYSLYSQLSPEEKMIIDARYEKVESAVRNQFNMYLHQFIDQQMTLGHTDWLNNVFAPEVERAMGPLPKRPRKVVIP